MSTATWDGKNLAVIQMLLAGTPRTEGRPCYEVTRDTPGGPMNLAVTGIPVFPGQQVELRDDGRVVILEPPL